MSEQQSDFDGIRYREEQKSPLVFRLLMGGLVAWAIGFISYFLFSGWSSYGEFAQEKQAKQQRVAAQGGAAATATGHKPASKGDLVAAGKAEFSTRCASCHGADAKGGIGPDLTRKKFTYGKTEEAVEHSINDGRPGGMPSFKSELPHDKVEALVQYVLSL